MHNLKYSEIISENKAFEGKLAGKPYRIATLSNITTSFINSILELSLRRKSVNAIVESGDYDNILQDSSKFANYDAVVIFWELCNIIDGFQYKALLLDAQQFSAFKEKVKQEIDLTLENLKDTPIIIFNKFSAISFTSFNLRPNVLDALADELNNYLESKQLNNLILIDLNKVFVKTSLTASLDFRFYYATKSLYTVDFYKEYVNLITPAFLSAQGKAKKAIIFDCDNTLWKGILGEDGIQNIQLSAKHKNGVYFEEVVALALNLAQNGMIIGICSKNNAADVDEVFDVRDDILIKNKDIVIKKVNWDDKAQNLQAIAADLNIAEESLVFIDDSDFEVNLIKDKLPHIACYQVPSKLYDYPNLIREVSKLFFNLSISEEDKTRNLSYKQEIIRNEEKKSIGNIEDYLTNLELKIELFKDDQSQVARAAQMTQKTNQFNLTTKRYAEADVARFVNDVNKILLSFSVSDKFGDYGITGLSIIMIDNKVANIDSLLMSCRVLGRNIERAFFDELMKLLISNQITEVKAQYLKTAKNQQVEDFYNKLGFNEVSRNENEIDYSLKIEDYQFNNINYIKTSYGR